MDCKLCQEKTADQTGSHIFTFSWIKSAINQVGKTKRDKEITFSTNPFNFGNAYFGRNVKPEKIEEILNREMTEEEIQNNKNYLVRDYLVCRQCEKRFTSAENYFNEKFYQPLKEHKFSSANDSKGNKIIEINSTQINVDIIRLNIYIQIWRASASRFNGFQLKSKVEEKLRKIINEIIYIDQTILEQNCAKNSERIRDFPLIITFAETDIKSKDSIELTGNIVFVGIGKMPYFLIINDIYIQFYEKESHLKSTIQHLFKLNNIIDRFEHYNFKEKNLKVGMLNDDRRIEVLKDFGRWSTEHTITSLSAFFIHSYKSIFGIRPNKTIVNIAISEVVNNTNVNEADRYKPENVSKSFAKVMHASLQR